MLGKDLLRAPRGAPPARRPLGRRACPRAEINVPGAFTICPTLAGCARRGGDLSRSTPRSSRLTGRCPRRLVRVEQISPFPFDQVAAYAATYANAEVVWAQEEPKNQGAWYFVRDRIMTATRVLNRREVRPGYCGRETMASTAEGYGAVHDAQQKHIIDVALSDELSALPFGALAAEDDREAAA